jgi:hypothetical protein
MHQDILKFLSYEDAVKLRLTNRAMLKECEEMRWNDCETRIKDFDKWLKCFPNSCGVLLQCVVYTHEKTDPSSKSLYSAIQLLQKQLLYISIPNFRITSWPLNILDNVKELSINLCKTVLNVILKNKISKHLVKLTCLPKSTVLDIDVIHCSFDANGSLRVSSNFWSELPLLEEFDCSCTKLTHAILDSTFFCKNKLQIVRVNHFFDLNSKESRNASSLGVKIVKKVLYFQSSKVLEERVTKRIKNESESETEL